MTREEQIKEYISTYIEQYAKSADCHPEEIEHFGFFIRMGINWADRHPKDEVNWQQVRIQAAIAAMQGIMTNYEYVKEFHYSSPNVDAMRKDIAKACRSYSDELVKELKGE